MRREFTGRERSLLGRSPKTVSNSKAAVEWPAAAQAHGVWWEGRKGREKRLACMQPVMRSREVGLTD